VSGAFHHAAAPFCNGIAAQKHIQNLQNAKGKTGNGHERSKLEVTGDRRPTHDPAPYNSRIALSVFPEHEASIPRPAHTKQVLDTVDTT
jgi:hypothetical protein